MTFLRRPLNSVDADIMPPAHGARAAHDEQDKAGTTVSAVTRWLMSSAGPPLMPGQHRLLSTHHIMPQQFSRWTLHVESAQ